MTPPVPAGLQAGPLRVDWGDGWADLECDVCSAGWTGPIGEPCGWCALRIEQTLADQRRLLLHPELPDRRDQRRTEALKAWAQRLATAVTADVITEHEARTAIERNQ